MEKNRSSRNSDAFMLMLGWASAIFFTLLAAYAIYQVTSGMFVHLQDELAISQATPSPF